MNFARITSKGQMPIPKRVRELAHLREGDVTLNASVVIRSGGALSDTDRDAVMIAFAGR